MDEVISFVRRGVWFLFGFRGGGWWVWLNGGFAGGYASLAYKGVVSWFGDGRTLDPQLHSDIRGMIQFDLLCVCGEGVYNAMTARRFKCMATM